MNNEIYTYFDASLGLPHQGHIFFHWYHSWKNHGWEPRLLHPRTCLKHPWRKAMKATLKKQFPDDPVAQARGLTILAIESLEKGILFSEYDVINYTLEPCESLNHPLKFPGIKAVQGFGAYGVLGTMQLAQLYLEGKGKHCEMAKSNSRMEAMGLYGSPGWRDRPLVHFSREACKGVPKYRVVEECGRRY